MAGEPAFDHVPGTVLRAELVELFDELLERRPAFLDGRHAYASLPTAGQMPLYLRTVAFLMSTARNLTRGGV
ncbi:hypothetical protein Misp02_39250 [Microtetraspora sp. NBRC 16547]|nr:hypothetical protein Misp02_39250 [Microtetraspora sp. NBRC 16547]